MSFDLFLSRDGHDLVFAKGADGRAMLRFVEGPAQVAQAVKIHLRTWLGDWFLDRDDGVPYLEEIIGPGKRLDTIEAILRAEILSVNGADAIEQFEISLNSQTRLLSIAFIVSTATGPAEGQLAINVNTVD